jgi:hypothetical protein
MISTPKMIYMAHPRYRLFALGSAVLAMLFGGDLLRSFEVGALLFFCVCLGIAVWYARTMFSQVEVGRDRVRVNRPYAAPQEVEFRQLVSVAEEGRMGTAIMLSYHPKSAQGLLDLDSVQTLMLPAVVNQEALYNHLSRQVPV